LATGDVDFFANTLNRAEYYRIALQYPKDVMFLDIETTGLSRFYDKITLIGWSKDGGYSFWLRGQDISSLARDLQASKAIVTFNGSLFDIPFLLSEFPDLKFPKPHVDLRFLARRVGLSGGQKSIESILGFERGKGLRGIDGEAAPLLWHRFIRGDDSSGKLLVEYNISDIAGMYRIFTTCVRLLLEQQDIPKPIHPLGSLKYFDQPLRKPRVISIIASEIARSATIPKITTAGSLLSERSLANLCVVGIDLTGSEKRPSGWCVLKQGKVETRRIATTAELISATVACSPNLVSIDSPLTLPTGWDSSHLESGETPQAATIMRECERILKRRGVNVYPCLIPSMRSLTRRGISLATDLRAAGTPVIESFPGAAQDIMGIPRKRASLELLKMGLAEFGLSGDFAINDVSHDELDAITSAIVGVFFWSGRFEALGNFLEEYLIIPDVSTPTPRRWPDIVVGLSGPIAAGKTTSAEHLSRAGFFYARFSLVLTELLGVRGIPVSRSTLQAIGEEVHESPGQRWLNKKLAEKLPGHGAIVVDGLRWPEDHAFLVETFGPSFLHIHIDAPLPVRRERYIRAGGTKGQFRQACLHPVEKGISGLATLAHASINNDQDTSVLGSQIEAAYTKFKPS
jgi:predicted nuclease with RNAse H fold/dephospho-CoA kinase